MSVKINLVEIIENYIESEIDIDISTEVALEVLKQNLTENIEAGAPPELIDEMFMVIAEGFDQIQTQYIKYKKNISKIGTDEILFQAKFKRIIRKLFKKR